MRVLIALVVLVTFALLASSRRWWRWRRAPIGAMLTTGGWVMVVLGLLLGPDGVGLMNDTHAQVLRPLVLFCLGWIGMMVGLQLRRDLPTLLPKGSVSLSGRDYAATMLLVGVVAMGVMAATGSRDIGSMIVIALLLATASVGWSAEMRSIGGTGSGGRVSGNLLRASAGLGAVWAVLSYGVIFMMMGYGKSVGGSIGGSGGLGAGWGVLIGVGISVAIALVVGLLAWWLVQYEAETESQFLVVLLGLVALAAGAAATMGYSPLWVGMGCGLVVVNLPGQALNRMKRVLIDAEQPVAMALMLMAGVLAKPTMRWEYWVLAGAVVGARWVVKQGVVRRKLLWWTPVSGKSGAVASGPMRQAPLAIALATGYVVSGHARATESVIGGGQLLMVVIVVGLGAEVIAGIGVMRHGLRQREAASGKIAAGGNA